MACNAQVCYKSTVNCISPKFQATDMNVIKTAIPEVLIIEPKLFGDSRGFFLETYQHARYAEHGIKRPFIQDNMSRSAYGVLRVLHLQNPNAQGKLVSVMRGRVLDVAV